MGREEKNTLVDTEEVAADVKVKTQGGAEHVFPSAPPTLQMALVNSFRLTWSPLTSGGTGHITRKVATCKVLH